MVPVSYPLTLSPLRLLYFFTHGPLLCYKEGKPKFYKSSFLFIGLIAALIRVAVANIFCFCYLALFSKP